VWFANAARASITSHVRGNMTKKYAEVARLYSRDNVAMFDEILEANYERIYSWWNDSEVLQFYAVYTCEVAVLVRKHTGVDICTLAFPIEKLTLPSSHPLMTVLPLLELMIEDQLKYLATAPDDRSHLDNDARMQILAAEAKMRASFIWKGYLLALNTEPADWRTDAVCALSALRILCTTDSTKVINIVRSRAVDEIRNLVRDDDWPPRAFINLYVKHSDLIEGKLFSREERRSKNG